MKFILTKLVQVLPVLFGVGFLGPALAETIIRTSLIEHVPSQLNDAATIYTACMSFGFIYGVFAVRSGRWI